MISPGTELWQSSGRFTWSPTRYPAVPGYQRVGIVEAVGEGVSGYEVGQRVFATVARHAQPLAAQFGAHAALAPTPAEEVLPLPAGLSDLDASGLVVAQVGLNAAMRSGACPGELVLVVGDGLIGQCAAQAARALGANVIMAGHRPGRLALAEAGGAVGVNARPGTLADTVREAARGVEVDIILDTAQSLASQADYAPLLRRGRTRIVYCGFTPSGSWADMGELQKLELTTHFVSGWTRERLAAAADLLAIGRMSLARLVQHQVSPREAATMYQLLRAPGEASVGVVFDWGAQ
jgi:bacteriochlorophyllide a dehydrogenase